MTPQLDYLYNEPKWQAHLTDESKFFVCQDGGKIRSLWELRESLLSVSEETFNAMVSEEYNHLATWVADSVGDSTLAADLQSRKGRWEILSALESYMIRSLAVPGYLAFRWLELTSNSFTTKSGDVVKNLRHAREMLQGGDNNALLAHLKSNKQDFSDWARGAIGDYMLSDMVEDADSGEKAAQVVIDHVAMLETALER